MEELMCENLLRKDVKLTWNVYSLNLISILKSSFSLSIFTPSASVSILILKKVNAEISFTPSYLELFVTCYSVFDVN